MKTPVQSLAMIFNSARTARPARPASACRERSPHKLAAISIVIAIITPACIEEREPKKSSNNLDDDMSMVLDMMADQTPPADQGACGVCQAGQVCDEASKQCVQCTTHAECPDPEHAQCERGRCVGCQDTDSCAHLAPLSRCSSANRRCVQCLPTSEDQDCPNTSCNPSTNACTSTPIGSLYACDECLSDSECAVGMRCVGTLYQGSPVGSFCLPIARDASDCEFNDSLVRSVITKRRSVGGVLEDYCGPDEALHSCHSLKRFGQACQSDSDCSLPRLSDGFCHQAQDSKTCTYICEASTQCLESCDVDGIVIGKVMCR